MRKIYLVKKDPTKDGQDNWITMNSYEFAMFMKTPEGQERKDNFGQLDACEKDDNIIVMECGAERARKWRAEKDRHDYLVEQKIASGYTTFSYSSIYSEYEDVTGEEMLQDEECDVEETAIHNLSLADMRQAINSLNSEEKKLISILLDYEMNITLSRLSELMGLTFEQTRYMRDCAYAKIRSFMGE